MNRGHEASVHDSAHGNLKALTPQLKSILSVKALGLCIKTPPQHHRESDHFAKWRLLPDSSPVDIKRLAPIQWIFCSELYANLHLSDGIRLASNVSVGAGSKSPSHSMP
jgi:hypothetical protein